MFRKPVHGKKCLCGITKRGDTILTTFRSTRCLGALLAGRSAIYRKIFSHIVRTYSAITIPSNDPIDHPRPHPQRRSYVYSSGRDEVTHCARSCPLTIVLRYIPIPSIPDGSIRTGWKCCTTVDGQGTRQGNSTGALVTISGAIVHQDGVIVLDRLNIVLRTCIVS
jgi:hypothetical protein